MEVIVGLVILFAFLSGFLILLFKGERINRRNEMLKEKNREKIKNENN